MPNLKTSLAAALLLGSPALIATDSAAAPRHGHASTTIVDAAVATPDLSTLVSALQAAGLVNTLSSRGPFTVFAPTNDAFARLPAGTVDTLLRPENKRVLTSVLTYHVVAGSFDAAAILRKIKQGHGVARLTTVQGQPLTVRPSGSSLAITDAKGGTSRVTLADLKQSNGVVHVIDGVLMPTD